MPSKETVLRRKYGLDTLQNRRDIQLACTMHRLSKFDCFIERTMYRDNLRSEHKVKFICPFTFLLKLGKVLFIGEWISGTVSKFSIIELKTKRVSRIC